MTATEVYESVTNGGTSDFADVAAILSRNKPWCLIGGPAVNCYVDPVYTIDVDLVVVVANLPQIERELVAAGFQVERFQHSRNAHRAESKLNLQFKTDPRYQSFLGSETEHEVLGIRVPVASLENIIRGKFGRGRTRLAGAANARKTSSICFESQKRTRKCEG